VPQANLPSCVYTILRTAGALRPFPFNDPPTANQLCGSYQYNAAATAAAIPLMAKFNPRQTRVPQPVTATPAVAATHALCALCSAPLAPDEVDTAQPQPEPVSDALAKDLRAACCMSCRNHVLSKLLKSREAPTAGVPSENGSEAKAASLLPFLENLNW
jgi:hypothetical protein